MKPAQIECNAYDVSDHNKAFFDFITNFECSMRNGNDEEKLFWMKRMVITEWTSDIGNKSFRDEDYEDPEDTYCDLEDDSPRMVGEILINGQCARYTFVVNGASLSYESYHRASMLTVAYPHEHYGCTVWHGDMIGATYDNGGTPSCRVQMSRWAWMEFCRLAKPSNHERRCRFAERKLED